MNRVKKGNYYKKRTKEWFQKQGYDCCFAEHAQSIWTPKGVIYKKSDIFGSDVIAMNDSEIIFINSKSNKVDVSKGLKEFSKYNFPSFVKRYVVLWGHNSREPIITEFAEDNL